MKEHVFLQRVTLKNYKSIAACDVRLGPLTFLVGPNGSGKSNFLDALRFVTDSLRRSVDHALRDRGGIKEVRRRSGGHPTHFAIRLDFALPSGERGHYSFRISSAVQAGFTVQDEECTVIKTDARTNSENFRVREGAVVSSTLSNPPASAPDRLYLVNASGFPQFRPVYDALSKMGFYNLNPDHIRDLQPPDTGDILARDGSNLASVLSHLSKRNEPTKKRIEEFLAKVVPGVRAVEAKHIGPKETLEFKQDVAGSKDPWSFFAANMSDGTLRALGVLVALFQGANGVTSKVPIVGIEEPEVALHPAAAGVILDSLREASRHTQVIVTSHSPDLLDYPKIDTDSIYAVDQIGGATRIAPIDEAGKSALKDRLYTAGELLRLNQLNPDSKAVPDQSGKQLKLFDDEATS